MSLSGPYRCWWFRVYACAVSLYSTVNVNSIFSSFRYRRSWQAYLYALFVVGSTSCQFFLSQILDLSFLVPLTKGPELYLVRTCLLPPQYRSILLIVFADVHRGVPHDIQSPNVSCSRQLHYGRLRNTLFVLRDSMTVFVSSDLCAYDRINRTGKYAPGQYQP